jgi:DNA-binding CsgD family transcriptional regulator/uncharacterized protein YkwD
MPRDLTSRQAEILELVAAGLGDKEIAGRLHLSVPTVRTHLQRLYREHGYRNRAEAAAGWVATQHRLRAEAPQAPVATAAVPSSPSRVPAGARSFLGLPAAAAAGLLLLAALMRPDIFIAAQRQAAVQGPASPGPTASVRAEEAAPSAPTTTPSAPGPAVTGAAAQTAAPSPPPSSPPPGSAPPHAALPPAAAPQVQAATAQLAIINKDRAAAGLPPLQWNSCLASAAGQVANGLAKKGYLAPTNGPSLDASCGLAATPAAENAGYWSTISDSQMNALFMSDPVQRARTLGPYHYTGAAWATTPGGAAYLVVEFV